MNKCPACGSKVTVHSSDDGTGYYVPIDGKDTAIEAILSLPARNLTRQQAIQVINTAFNDKGE